MIEIRIPTNAAIIFLSERMQYEKQMRETVGEIYLGLNLNDLSFEELLPIAETAAFDLVSLLPAEILSEKSNIADIVYKAISALSRFYGKDEFKNYSKSRAENLLKPIWQLFQNAVQNKSFLNN